MAYVKAQLEVLQQIASTGAPLVGGSISAYIWNTSTLTPMYTDSAGGGSATSFTLNSLGMPQSAGGTAVDIFLDDTVTYKFIIRDSSNQQVGPTIGPISVGIDGKLVTATDTLTALSLARHFAHNLTITMFGAPTDGTSDCLAAFNAFLSAIPAEGAYLIFPHIATNKWNFTAPLNIRKMVHIRGQVSQAGSSSLHGTQLIFPADVSGIILNSATTSLYTTAAADASQPGAYGSVLENLMILGSGGSTSADGVVFRCQAECRKVTARGFYRYGFRIYATSGGGGSIEGDANQWVLHNCKAIANGSHGLYVDGNDANTGVCTKFFAQLNGGYGVYENSLIGNTYIGVDTVGNTSGPMWAARASSAVTVIGLWEDDVGSTSTFGANVTSIGGDNGNATSASAGFTMAGGVAFNAPYKYLNQRSTPDVGAAIGVNDSSYAVMSFGTATESPTTDAWKWQYDNTAHVWHYQYAASSSFQPMAIPNSSGTIYSNRTFTGPIFQNGLAIKNAGEAYSAARVQMRGTAAPVSGTWVVGDIVWADNVTAGGYIGWVCTTAGTPGTWRTFGAVS